MRDEHINNIIYQSLTINASLNIVLLADPEKETLKSLKEINDPRIFFIWGVIKEKEKEKEEEKEEKIHWFKYIANTLMPTIKTDKELELLKNFNEQITKDAT